MARVGPELAGRHIDNQRHAPPGAAAGLPLGASLRGRRAPQRARPYRGSLAEGPPPGGRGHRHFQNLKNQRMASQHRCRWYVSTEDLLALASVSLPDSLCVHVAALSYRGFIELCGSQSPWGRENAISTHTKFPHWQWDGIRQSAHMLRWVPTTVWEEDDSDTALFSSQEDTKGEDKLKN